MKMRQLLVVVFLLVSVVLWEKRSKNNEVYIIKALAVSFLFLLVSFSLIIDPWYDMIFTFAIVDAIAPMVLMETVALKWILNFNWKKTIYASIVLNSFSSFVCYSLSLPKGMPNIYAYCSGGLYTLVDAGITAGLAVFGILLELIILKIVFNPILSTKRVSAFVFANILSMGIVFWLHCTPVRFY